MTVSSEDEAWMKQAAYHFSDSSDEDEGDTAINEVYLQAVQALKQKANSTDKLSTSISDSDPESQLPCIQSEQLPPICSEAPSSIQHGAEARAKPASAAQASHQPVEACIDKPPQLTTMEVLSLLFPKEQPPIAAAAAAASSTSGVTSDVPVTPAAATDTVTDTTAALPAIAAAAAAPSAATMPAADSQPAPFLSGHSMLTTIVQQMAEAITSAAVQVVEARRLQKQQHCSVLAAALPGMSLATSLADERQVAQVASSMAMTATSQPKSSLFTMSAAAGALSTGSFFEQAVSGAATPPEAISVAAASAVASRAAEAAAPAAAVSDMPSSKLKVKKPGIMSGGSTHDAGQAAAPELHKKAPPMKLGPPPPVRMGPPPPVRLGPPPPVRLGPPPPPVMLGPPPPVRLGPPPYAWPQPQWAPPQPNVTAYWSRPAIAPPRPPPGGPLFPPSMPSLASSHVPPSRQSLPVSKKMKRSQARSAQKQAVAVKPAQPAKKVGRGLKRASSIGSVDSNNGDEDGRAQPSARKAAFASAGAQAAETGQPAKGRKHEKRLRRCAKQRAKLAESAQQAFTKALVKSVQGAVRKQETQVQAPKSAAPKMKKTKAEYKAEHIQRLRRGKGHIDISYLK